MVSDPLADRLEADDREYVRAHRAWIAKLKPRELAEIARLGMTNPQDISRQVSSRSLPPDWMLTIDPFGVPSVDETLSTIASTTDTMFRAIIGDRLDPVAIWRRVLILAFESGSLPEVRTLAQLAALLRVSPGRVTQLKDEIAGFQRRNTPEKRENAKVRNLL